MDDVLQMYDGCTKYDDDYDHGLRSTTYVRLMSERTKTDYALPTHVVV